MAYDKETLKKRGLEAIEKNKLFFIEDIIAYLGIAKQTFYNHKLHEDEEIIEALETNKISIKVGLRSKWYKSNTPVTQMALYKLISTPDELKRLSMQHIDADVKGNIVHQITGIRVISSEPDKKIEK
jgi:hypothetical protein